MKILITSGSTAMMIDKVRMISNVFKGKTGHAIAEHFSKEHDVTLLTSNKAHTLETGKVVYYKTYDELYDNMETMIKSEGYDVIVHSSAVSDYKAEGVYVDEATDELTRLVKLDSSKKISSEHDEMYIKLTQTRKIVDDIRDWGFTGTLVKFKLQVGITDEELLDIAKKSRAHSDAEIIVANCLEWARDRAYIVTKDDVVDSERNDLPKWLMTAIIAVRQ